MNPDVFIFALMDMANGNPLIFLAIVCAITVFPVLAFFIYCLWVCCGWCFCSRPRVILSITVPRSMPSIDYRANIDPSSFSYGYHNALARRRQAFQFQDALATYNAAPGNIDNLRDSLNLVRVDFDARVPANISGLSDVDMRDKLTNIKHSDYTQHTMRVYTYPCFETQRLLYAGAHLPPRKCWNPRRPIKCRWILPSPHQDQVEIIHLPTCRKLADDMALSLRSAWGSFFIRGPREYSPAEHSYYFGYHVFQNVTVQLKDQGAFQKNGCTNAATVEVAILIWMQANNIPMPYMSFINHLTPRQAELDHAYALEYFRTHEVSEVDQRPYFETLFVPSTVGLGLGVHSSNLLVYQDPSSARTSTH